MKIVVLGAAGQLGQSVAACATARGHQVIAWGRAQGDITQPKSLAAALREVAPEAVFNCAAYARVDEAEDEPDVAMAANAWAVRDLARLSGELGFVLVHYSTDFVFDGVVDALHTETDPTNPGGVYATSKLIGERFAADAARHYTLRVESLFGGPKAKSSVDMLLRGLIEGRTVTPFSDRTVTPSYVEDVANASCALVETRAPFGLYHCVNTGATTWYELTVFAATLLGRPTSLIAPGRMAGLTMRVPRPLKAAMSNAKLTAAGVVMPTWQDAITRYVATLQRHNPPPPAV